MKKIYFAAMLALLMFATVFSTVLAKSSEVVVIDFRNKTGATITLTLQGYATFTLPPGVGMFEAVAGKYDFYVQTACGNAAGTLRLDQGKGFIFACPDGGNGITVTTIEPPPPPCIPVGTSNGAGGRPLPSSIVAPCPQ